jgi:hypothetical protein
MEGEELFRSKTDPFLEQTFRSSVACLNQKLKNSRFPIRNALFAHSREKSLELIELSIFIKLVYIVSFLLQVILDR